MTKETLSDKRKELYELHKNVIPSAFMLLIEKQDKEFIKIIESYKDHTGMIIMPFERLLEEAGKDLT